MKIEITIPSLGESVSEAIISSIMKPSGSYVKRDEEILEIETDKVNQVLYSPGDGEISLTVKVDDKVAIGQVIGYVDTSKQGSVDAAPKIETPKKAEPSAPKMVEGETRKKVESFAQEVSATQPIPSQEKEAPKSEKAPSAQSKKDETPRFTRKKMSNLRKVISHKLVEAKNTTAMLTTFNEIDMGAVMELRSKEKDSFEKKHGVKLGFMSFFVKAVVSALKAIPEVNAIIDGEDVLQFHTYDIGVAVSTDKGLMVPVIKDCDKLSFAGVEKEVAAFAQKAREGKIAIDDLKGGSFTITNGGVFGSLLSTPILNSPQSAILGMHAIVKRPVAIGDKVEVRPMMYVALSYDHRLIDGKEAVQFLVHIKQMIEDPAKLFLEL